MEIIGNYVFEFLAILFYQNGSIRVLWGIKGCISQIYLEYFWGDVIIKLIWGKGSNPGVIMYGNC